MERRMKAIVDADSMVYRIAIKNEDNSDQEAIRGMADYMEGLIYDDLCYCDSHVGFLTKGQCFRYNIAKTVPYKGNRKDYVKPKHHQLLFDYLVSAWGFTVCEEIEADDAVGIEQSRVGIDDSLLVHIDKDLDQYEGQHYNFAKKLRYEVSAFDGLTNLFVQCLTGDKADNILGLRGIGPVKARKALAGCKTQQEMFNKCVEMYLEHERKYPDCVNRVNENLSLLYLMRDVDDFWKPMEIVDENEETT